MEEKDLEEKIEEQEEQLGNDEIDKEEKEKPLSIIKKEIIIGVLIFLILIIAYAFAKSFSNKNKPTKAVETEAVGELKNKTTKNNEEVTLKNNYEGVSIGELLKNNTQKNDEKSKEKNEKIILQMNSLEDDYFSEEMKRYQTKLVQDELQARNSSLGFGIVSNDKKTVENNEYNGFEMGVERGTTDPIQAQKEFLKSEEANNNYNLYQETKAYSPYEVKQGTVIPAIMWTGMDSTLPGNIIGIVREDVYDTVSGNYLLIPKGTKIAGKYDSAIQFGQDRILFVWQRLIFPDGKSLNLNNFPGTDLSGYAGITGKVDNHIFELLQGVVLSSILGAGAAVITQNEDDDDDWRAAAGVGAGEQLISIGDTWVNKLVNVPPRIKVAPGTKFNIIVSSDLILSPWSGR